VGTAGGTGLRCIAIASLRLDQRFLLIDVIGIVFEMTVVIICLTFP
jgi:hypothetical protein